MSNNSDNVRQFKTAIYNAETTRLEQLELLEKRVRYLIREFTIIVAVIEASNGDDGPSTVQFRVAQSLRAVITRLEEALKP